MYIYIYVYIYIINYKYKYIYIYVYIYIHTHVFISQTLTYTELKTTAGYLFETILSEDAWTAHQLAPSAAATWGHQGPSRLPQLCAGLVTENNRW